jgi:hypothetical protein
MLPEAAYLKILLPHKMASRTKVYNTFLDKFKFPSVSRLFLPEKL